MNIPYINTGKSYVFFFNGQPATISKDDARYNSVLEALENDDEATLTKLLTHTIDEFITAKVSEMLTEDFGDLKLVEEREASGKLIHKATYKTVPLPKCMTDKLISLWKSGCKDFKHYFMFLDNLMANPSDRARNELYTFLEYKELPITANGTFIAYKGVDKDLISIHGNKQTRVLSGERLSDGRIKNNIGDVIRVVTEDVDNDCNNHCSNGLHVGSYDYASGFVGSNGVVLATEVNPRDVVSVPLDCSCQKCRVSSYKVLNRVAGEYSTPDVTVGKDNTVKATNNTPRIGKAKKLAVVFKDVPMSEFKENVNKQISSHSVLVNRSTNETTVIPVTAMAGVSKNSTKVAFHAGVTTLKQLAGSVGKRYKVKQGELLNALIDCGYKTTAGATMSDTLVALA